jgi:hypothetical protein
MQQDGFLVVASRISQNKYLWIFACVSNFGLSAKYLWIFILEILRATTRNPFVAFCASFLHSKNTGAPHFFFRNAGWRDENG